MVATPLFSAVDYVRSFGGSLVSFFYLLSLWIPAKSDFVDFQYFPIAEKRESAFFFLDKNFVCHRFWWHSFFVRVRKQRNSTYHKENGNEDEQKYLYGLFHVVTLFCQMRMIIQPRTRTNGGSKTSGSSALQYAFAVG